MTLKKKRFVFDETGYMEYFMVPYYFIEPIKGDMGFNKMLKDELRKIEKKMMSEK